MIAQLNVAYAKAPLDSPEMADFVNNLDRINMLAESSSGFVWRLQTDEGHAIDIKLLDDPRFILNLSVWQSVRDLHHFVFKTDHNKVMRRKDEWFMPSEKASVILWHIDDDAPMPTAAEAFERLAYFRENGPSDKAFTWRSAKDYGAL